MDIWLNALKGDVTPQQWRTFFSKGVPITLFYILALLICALNITLLALKIANQALNKHGSFFIVWCQIAYKKVLFLHNFLK